MYFGCVCFRGDLGLLDCDDICMCVVIKHFDILAVVFGFFSFHLCCPEVYWDISHSYCGLCVRSNVIVLGLSVMNTLCECGV